MLPFYSNFVAEIFKMEENDSIFHHQGDDTRMSADHALLSSPEVMLEIPLDEPRRPSAQRRLRRWFLRGWRRLLSSSERGLSYEGVGKDEEAEVMEEELADALSE